MKNKIQSLLHANTFIIIFAFLTLAYSIDIIDTDYVRNDKVLHEFLEKKEEQKYNEYDEYIADFEDDLKELDLPEEKTYNWEDFSIDAAFVIIPFLVACLGFSIVIFITFQFYDITKTIRFTHILKASTIAYLVFYIKDIVSSIWFLAIKREYVFEDIQSFYSKTNFSLAKTFGNPDSESWFQYLLDDLRLELLIYLLGIIVLTSIAGNVTFKKLIGPVGIAFGAGFILYESISIYLIL